MATLHPSVAIVAAGAVAMAVAVAIAAALLAPGWRTTAAPAAAAVPQPVPAPVVPALGFHPPDAGTYHLEHLFQTPDGAVLDSDGSAHRLREFITGRITVFSLVYTYCTDAKGCPLAYAALHALKIMLAGDPVLRGQVRFVSMSFDPEFDTPAMMRSYGGDDAAPAAVMPWHFLTTASRRDLAPVLAGFGQDVSVLARGAAGERAPVFSHLLKVYLIDRKGAVREIYTTAYLHPAVMRNDIATVLIEERAPNPPQGALPGRRIIASDGR